MRSLKAVLSCILAAAMSMTMFACGGAEEEVSMKDISADVRQQIIDLATNDPNLTGELENKTVKWMSPWDINPSDGSGKSTPLDLAIFQERYGGEIQWYQVNHNTRYDDLANAINSDEGIDFFFGGDGDAFPKGALRGMFVPYDGYIDLESELWADVKDANEGIAWQGKHYLAVTDITGDNCAVIYNRKTIEEAGLDDPAELFAEGEWDWDAFEEMLEEFCDSSAQKYGIDSWYYEIGLSQTTGVPYIGLEDGVLVNNLRDPDLERVQDWIYDLYTKDYIALGNGDYGWSSNPNYIGEGKLLFHPCGTWAIGNDTWKETFGEDMFFVPMPKDPESDVHYVAGKMNAYLFVKGGHNPEGAAKYLDCLRFSKMSDEVREMDNQKLRDDYGWTDEMIEMANTMNEMALENPTFDFYIGVSSDITDVLDSSVNGIRATAHGVPWAESVNAIDAQIQNFVDEVNEEAAASAN